MKKRIWELDALRGLCILGMIAFHALYDMVELYALVDWDYPNIVLKIRDIGGLIFFLISGICVTLGSHCIRRGLLVFACGMVCTLTTYGMYALGFADKGIIIYFGVLHCLGCCMLLWPLFKKLPWWALAALGLALPLLGTWLGSHVRASHMWLMPLGITPMGFRTSDYYPLIFHLGFFLLGATLGKTLYKNKATRFPKVNAQALPVRFLCKCGSLSLWIYLAHQPVLALIFTLLTLL